MKNHTTESPPAFRSFWFTDVNPVSGRRKRRKISDPNETMRALHRTFIGYIESLRIPMPSSTACGEGQSAVKNVLLHRKEAGRGFNRYFFVTDVSGAYQAVSLDKMIDVFTTADGSVADNTESFREFLQKNFFDGEIGGLVTGGVASPILFNLYCEVKIDRKLRELCRQYGLTYTRYLDDLTFSSVSPIGRKKRKALRAVIQSAGMKLSDAKSNNFDLRKGPVAINGVGVCLDGRMFLPRRTLSHIRGLLHTAVTKGGIAPSVIHGKMGLVKQFCIRPNRTEQKVLSLYQEFCYTLGKSLVPPCGVANNA